MKRKLLSGTFVLLLFFCSSMLAISDSISGKFIRFHDLFPQEKAYLHLSKPHYRLGETIWFKAYLVNGSTHLTDTKSDVLRVELIDPNGKIVAQRILSKTHNRMSGDINLDVSLNPGRYTIRAYTNWMRNFDQDYFYSSTFNVFKGNGLTTYGKSNANEKELDLAFFPEGGDLIIGLESKVALKAIDRFGKGVNVQGVVVDATNAKVASFETNQLGFAQFKILPQAGMSYKAQLSTSGEDYSFELPPALPKGYAVSIANGYESEKIKISLTAKDVGLKNSTVLIHQRGVIQYSTIIEETSSTFSLELIKKELNPGIYHLTLFDQNDLPVVERLFAVNLDSTNSRIKLEKEAVYTRNTSAKVTISLKDLNEKALSGSLSASVTKENGGYFSHDQNIKNHLLLSSDLKGSIEMPSTYFNATSESHDRLDLLLLTQGWTRFSWNEVLSDSLRTVDFSAEKRGVAISGTVVDFYNRSKVREGIISMSSFVSSTPIELLTDPQGRFRIPNLNFPDSIDLIFNSSRKVNKKGKLRDDTFIEMDKEESPLVPENPLIADLSNATIDKLLEEVDSSNLTLLDEVVIEGTREVKEVKDPFERARSLYLNPSIRIIADSVFKKRVAVKNVAGFMRNIPGVAIIGTGPSAMVRLQGLGSQKRIVATIENMAPLYLINGVPTSETSIFSLNQFDVYYIDILRGAQASLFGTRGSNGVIAIYLRPAELAKTVPRPGSLFHQFPGYYASKKFEFTDIMKSNLAKDPLGISVHWNPSILLNGGKGLLGFDLPDEPGNYFIRMEGMAENGSPIFLEESILVR